MAEQDPIKNRDVITKVYQELLGRDPDPSGLANFSGQSESMIRRAVEGSGEFEKKAYGSVRPATVNPGFEANWKFDDFMSEWNSVSKRPPTQYEYENWMRFGKPKQLQIERSGKAFDLIADNGTKIKVYKDLSALGDDPFDFGHPNDIVAVPEGTKMAGRWRKLDTQNGFELYTKPEEHGGLLGKAADLTGIKEFETIRDKWIPKELFATPIAGPIFGGSRSFEGAESIADQLGMKPEEILAVSNWGTRVGVALVTVGNPGAIAFAEALIQAGELSAGRTDIEDALKNVGIAGVSAQVGELVRGADATRATRIVAGSARGATRGALSSAAFGGGNTFERIAAGAIGGAGSEAGWVEAGLSGGVASSLTGGNTRRNMLNIFTTAGTSYMLGNRKPFRVRRNVFDSIVSEVPKSGRKVATAANKGFQGISKATRRVVKGNKESFDPEGSGYDTAFAKQQGIKADRTGHFPSRDPKTGRILKGRKHPTFNKTIEGEKAAGFEIFKGRDGFYYSKPK